MEEGRYISGDPDFYLNIGDKAIFCLYFDETSVLYTGEEYYSIMSGEQGYFLQRKGTPKDIYISTAYANIDIHEVDIDFDNFDGSNGYYNSFDEGYGFIKIINIKDIETEIMEADAKENPGYDEYIKRRDEVRKKIKEREPIWKNKEDNE